MKKLMIALGVMLMVTANVAVALDPDSGDTGTRLGANACISNGVTGAIAIGDGATNSAAIVTASSACQIGKGKNTTANTIKYLSLYLLGSTTTGTVQNVAISAAQLTAGTKASAINGNSITNLNSASLVGNAPDASVTNAVADLHAAGYPWSTNLVFGGTGFVVNVYGQIVGFKP